VWSWSWNHLWRAQLYSLLSQSHHVIKHRSASRFEAPIRFPGRLKEFHRRYQWIEWQKPDSLFSLLPPTSWSKDTRKKVENIFFVNRIKRKANRKEGKKSVGSSDVGVWSLIAVPFIWYIWLTYLQTVLPDQEGPSEGTCNELEMYSTRELAYYITLIDWDLFYSLHEVSTTNVCRMHLVVMYRL